MEPELRPLRPEDWTAVHDWTRCPEACRYQEWGPNTPEQTESYVRDTAATWSHRPQSVFAYAVEVGHVVRGMRMLHVRGHRQGELSYSVHPDLWGRGIGGAVGRRLLDIGFTELGLHRIFGTCDPRNIASGRILAGLGMTHEGRMRQNLLIRDGWRDSDLYSILATEWSPVQA